MYVSVCINTCYIHDTYMKIHVDHKCLVPEREQLRQRAQRLSVGLLRHAARNFGVRRIERIIVDEEGGSVALHTPVGKDACPVDYHEPA